MPQKLIFAFILHILCKKGRLFQVRVSLIIIPLIPFCCTVAYCFSFLDYFKGNKSSLVAQMVKSLPVMQET